MSNQKTVINRGVRTYDLKPGEDGTPRTLGPGKSIECLDDQEFRMLSGMRDIADADKILPHTAKRIEVLEAELAKAKAENQKLKKETPEPVAEVKAPESEPEQEKEVEAPHKKKKGK